jgi:shikimate dehydrogenase
VERRRGSRDAPGQQHQCRYGSTPPLDLDLTDFARRGAVVCDIVYVPLTDQAPEGSRRARLKTMDGLGMLMHQAAPSFEAFFGIDPQVDAGPARSVGK